MVIPNVFGKRCSYYLVDLSLARRGTRLLKKAKALSFYFYSCVVLLNYSRDTAIFA